jgi:hypothetical protein
MSVVTAKAVHVQVGPVSVILSRDSYLQVVEMLNRSAANFEVLLERKQRLGGLTDNPLFDE